MVTKSDLLLDDERRAAIAKDEAIARDIASEKSNREHEKEQCDLAGRLLDSDLGDFIKAVNAIGIKTVFCDCYKNWCISGDNRGDEIYAPTFSLRIAPLPFKQSKPMRILRKKLKDAGFECDIVTEVHDNYETEFYGDGEYTFKRIGGTHDVHFLKISW